MVIVNTKKEWDVLQRKMRTQPFVYLQMLSDVNKHSKQNRISCFYVGMMTSFILAREFWVSALREFNAIQNNSNAIKAYRFSNGSLPNAVADLKEGNEDELYWFIDWMRNCIGAKYDFLSRMSEQFKQISRAKKQIKMRWALEMIRNAILVKGAEDLISSQGAERVFILKFSHAINLQGLELIYKDLSETLYYLERHAHSQMAQLALSIRLSQIIRINRE